MEFHEIEVTEEMKRIAREKADKLGELRNSLTRGEGNFAGYIGELIAQKVIGGTIEDTRDYDIVTEDGTKWDVKTKRCKGAPEPHFECSITNFNTTQKCDRYIFVRVQHDYSRGWVVGELTKDDYFKNATFIQQGQYDPRNRWRASCDCWNVPIASLNEVKQISPSDTGTVSA